jgi:hypothetical protein
MKQIGEKTARAKKLVSTEEFEQLKARPENPQNLTRTGGPAQEDLKSGAKQLARERNVRGKMSTQQDTKRH